jgi:hypothetical protein
MMDFIASGPDSDRDFYVKVTVRRSVKEKPTTNGISFEAEGYLSSHELNELIKELNLLKSLAH